jgi:hypothetical protein
MRKLAWLLLFALPALAQYSPSGQPSTSNSVGFQPLAKTSLVSASTTSANIALVPSAAVTGVAITGTAGQFSCTCSYLSVGMSMTITGTYGGTGSISGYASPSTYLVSAVGSGTFQLSQGGVPIATTAGTPTGLTYTATANVSQQQIQIYNSTAGIAYVLGCATSSCVASVGSTGTSTADYPVPPGIEIVMTVPAGTTYMAVVLSTGSGIITFTPGIGL